MFPTLIAFFGGEGAVAFVLDLGAPLEAVLV